MQFTFKVTILLLLSALTLGGISPESASSRPGQDYALFFAVSEYQDGGLTNLPNTIVNARAIAAELKQSYGFQTEVVENPNLQQIADKIEEYRKLFAPNTGRYSRAGQLFVFFAGHGVKAYNNGYFLPADANPNQLPTTALAYDIWRPVISSIACRHILVAVDACYSVTFDPDWQTQEGGGPRRKNEPTEAEKILNNHKQYQARLFFTSDSKEDTTPGRSNFARKFLEGLRELRSRKGFVTAGELFSSYIQRAAPTPRQGDFEDDDPTSSFLFFPTPTGFDDSRADRDAWNQARNARTLSAYREYLRRFPDGEFRPLAEKEIGRLEAEEQDFLAWQKAKKTNTTDSYRRYLTAHPRGDYRELAQLALEERVGRQKKDIKMDLPKDGLVLIKGGSFEMGDQFGDGEDNEKPVHSVSVNDFYMGQYEVTVEEFSRFVNATKYQTDAEKGDGSYAYDSEGKWGKQAGVNWRHNETGKLRPSSEYNHPVVHVSWNDAVQYCNWLSRQNGYQPVYTINGSSVSANWQANGYRLPTEAEWEYAARSGGKKYKYAWGNSTTPQANIGDESLKKKYPSWSWSIWENYNDGYVYTAPADKFLQGDLGLHSITGNVWEWCWDWYGSDYYGESNNISNPKGPASGSYRVLRGGSWRYIPANVRCANRDGYNPDYRGSDVGFRLSRAAY